MIFLDWMDTHRHMITWSTWRLTMKPGHSYSSSPNWKTCTMKSLRGPGSNSTQTLLIGKTTYWKTQAFQLLRKFCYTQKHPMAGLDQSQIVNLGNCTREVVFLINWNAWNVSWIFHFHCPLKNLASLYPSQNSLIQDLSIKRPLHQPPKHPNTVTVHPSTNLFVVSKQQRVTTLAIQKPFPVQQSTFHVILQLRKNPVVFVGPPNSQKDRPIIATDGSFLSNPQTTLDSPVFEHMRQARKIYEGVYILDMLSSPQF